MAARRCAAGAIDVTPGDSAEAASLMAELLTIAAQ